ncbi:MAG: serine/threonine protein kinase [Gammaproteobacteria bacterium]|nr:serine/threonine protein kinase [Gammaproteobacteria bacterium]
MSYPAPIEYNEAIQNPSTAFLDQELKQGKIEENNQGLPLVLSGGFALTYLLTTRRGKSAVRCFHRQVPGVENKYALIGKKVKALNSNYFVAFDYQHNGIRVKDGTYPIVRMDWVDGDTLGVYLDKNYSDASKLRKLRSDFQALSAFLESSGIAHGDIQNGNVIISNNVVRLIDYDGMYVEGLSPNSGTEVGHKHFQHPGRAATNNFGPTIDRFSFIAIDLSLQALIEEKSLYKKYREGGETIIFKANDFADPQSSQLLQRLVGVESLRLYVERFISVCSADIQNVPSLSDFLAGKNIPSARLASVRVISPSTTQKPAGYIPAFEVVDATDYLAASRQIHNRVELIGKIHSIKDGVGKRGRGKGKRFVFINFGSWRSNIVKITIWSEGLLQLTEAPSEAWVGRWVSVVGLIDPPYQGQHYNVRYTHVGITITDGGQINFIGEKEARYRLESVASKMRQPAERPGNREILASIARNSTQSPSTSAKSSSNVTASTPNAAILAKIKQQNISPAAPIQIPFAPVGTRGQTSQPWLKLLRKIPAWIWAAVSMVLLIVLSKR